MLRNKTFEGRLIKYLDATIDDRGCLGRVMNNWQSEIL